MQKWEYLYVEVDFGLSKTKLINGQELREESVFGRNARNLL